MHGSSTHLCCRTRSVGELLRDGSECLQQLSFWDVLWGHDLGRSAFGLQLLIKFRVYKANGDDDAPILESV